MRHRSSQTLLTAEEEIGLARRIHGADRDEKIAARNELVLHNLGLVGRAVGSFRRRRGFNSDDLFSEGMIALIRAAELYDPDTHRTRFVAYAMPAVLNRLRHWMMSDFTASVPRYLQQASAARALALRCPNRSARSEARAEHNVRCAEMALRPFVSLSRAGDGDEAGDDIPEVVDPGLTPHELIIRHEAAERISEALRHIPPLQAYVLAHRRGLCGLGVRKLADLARELGVTRQRVYQIEQKAVIRLGYALTRPAAIRCA